MSGLNRNTPMPRGEGLQRKTRLEPGSPLKRGTGLTRAPRKQRAPRDTGPSRKVRVAVWVRAKGACESCGINVARRPHSIQHRVARGMGGTSDPAANEMPNLGLLCGDALTGCHGLAESRDPVMHARGFWLYSWENPAAVPLEIATAAGPAPVWLTADGRYSYEAPEGTAAA